MGSFRNSEHKPQGGTYRKMDGPGGGGRNPFVAYVSGLVNKGLTGVADTVMQSNPVTGTLATVQNAAKVGNLFAGRPEPVSPNLFSGYSRRGSEIAYKPQGVLAETADTLGTFTPNAALGGANMFARLGSVVAPTIGAETGRNVVRGFGGDERAQDVGRMVGAVAGAGVSAIRPPGASPGLRSPRPQRGQDVVDSLKTGKADAYAAVDNSGASYTPDAVSGLVSDIETAAAKARISKLRHPKAWDMLQTLRKEAKSGVAPSLTDLDQLRQVIRRDVVNRGDEAEQFFGEQMIAAFDRFAETAGPEHMNTGAGPEAASLLTNARRANTQYRKAEAVVDAVGRGTRRAASTGVGANADNAIRQELRRVLENTQNLSAEERAMLQRAVEGGPVQNALRYLGKLSPANGSIPMFANLAGAGQTGGASLPASAAATAAKMSADRITLRNVDKLLNVIANGAKPESEAAMAALERAAASDPQLRPVYERVLQQIGQRAAPFAPALASGAATASR